MQFETVPAISKQNIYRPQMTWSSSQSQTPVGIQCRHLHNCRWIWPQTFRKVCRHQCSSMFQCSFSLDLFGQSASQSASLRVLCFEHGEQRRVGLLDYATTAIIGAWTWPWHPHWRIDEMNMVKSWWGPAPTETCLFEFSDVFCSPSHLVPLSKGHYSCLCCGKDLGAASATGLKGFSSALAAIFLQSPGMAFAC